MPGWTQPFARYQPITPMVDAVRSLIVGSGSDVALALLWSVVLFAIFTPIAVWRYRRPDDQSSGDRTASRLSRPVW